MMEKYKQSKLFVCPSCNLGYMPRVVKGGEKRSPLLIECGHSVCESCLLKELAVKQNYTCTICQAVSTQSKILSSANVRSEFPLNTYLIGLLSVASYPNEETSLDAKIGFARPPSVRTSRTSVLCHECQEMRADCMCVQCNAPYCVICFKSVHEAARAFRGHKKTCLTATELERSGEGGLVVGETHCSIHSEHHLEFICEDCSGSPLCSRCLISNHSGHRVHVLADKNKECLDELIDSHVKVANVQKRLRATRKKAGKLVNKCSGLEGPGGDAGLSDLFARLHGLLIRRHCQLLAKLHAPMSDSVDRLKSIVHQIDEKIKDLDNLLTKSTSIIQMSPKYIMTVNYLDLLAKLREEENTPCHLLTNEGHFEGAKLIADESIYKLLEEYCQLDVNGEPTEYSLVTQEDLPLGFTVEPILELTRESIQSIVAVSDDSSTRRNSLTSTTSSVSSASKEASNAEDFHFPLVEFAPGSMIRVSLSHMTSPSDFYVQRVGGARQLPNLQAQLVRIAAARKTPPSEVSKGKIYLVKFGRDQKWYRGRVLEIEENKIHVFYIDYGNKEIVSRDRLRLMPLNLTTVPGLATHCCIHNCSPINGVWENQAISVMMQIPDVNGEVNMIVHKKEERLLLVDISSIQNGNTISLQESLIFLGLATITSSTDSVLNIRKPMIKKCTRRQEPAKGTVLDVIASFIHTPDDFYIVEVEASLIGLNKLMNGLKQSYKDDNHNGKLNIYNPKKGMIVAAQYSKDNEWYRAEIIEVPVTKVVELRYIDYGNTEILPWNRLRILLPKFYYQPPFAHKCKLVHLESLTGDWSEEACQVFGRVCSDQKLKVVVEESSPPHMGKDTVSTLLVVLFVTSSTMDTCVNALLVKNKLGKSTGHYSTIVEFPKAPKMNSTIAFNRKGGRAGKKRLKNDRVTERLPLDDMDKVTLPKQREEHYDKSHGAYKIRVTINTIFSPSEFYISPTWVSKEVNVLKEKLNETYASKVEGDASWLKTRTDWEVESLCCVNLERGGLNWHRAAILEVLPDNQYIVMLLDEGDRLAVEGDTMYSLASEFETVMQGSVRCHLGGVKSPIGSAWPTTSTEELRRICQAHPFCLFITKLGKEVEGKKGSMPVELLVRVEKVGGPLEPASLEYHSINNQLRLAGLATADGTVDWSGDSAISLCFNLTNEPTASFNKKIGVDKTEVTNPLACIENSSKKLGIVEVEKLLEATGLERKSRRRDNERRVSEGDKPGETELGDGAAELLKRLSEGEGGEVAKEQETEEEEEEVEVPEGSETYPSEVEDCGRDDAVVPLDWLPPLPFSDLEFLAKPTYIDDDAGVYIQEFHNSVLDLKKINEELNSMYKGSQPEAYDLFWSPGQICIAKFHSDQDWYRAKVIKCFGKKKLSVQFVDFGNVEECHPADLRKITMAHDKPVQCHRCMLHSIVPNNENGKWTTELLDYVHQFIVDKHCQIRLTILPDDQYGIEELVLPGGQELMKSLTMGGVFKYREIEEAFPNHLITYHLQQPQEEIVIEDEVEEVEADDTKREVEVNSTLYWADVLDKVSNDGWRYRRAEIPKDCTRLQVEMTAVLSLSRVLVQIKDGPNIQPQLKESQDKFGELMAEIQREAPLQPSLRPPFLYKACCAQFSEDEKWYRGIVVAEQSDERLFVQYVDYGNVEQIHKDMLKETKEDWVSRVCVETVEVWLAGLEDWGAEVGPARYQWALNSLAIAIAPQLDMIIKERKGEKLYVELRTNDGRLAYESLIKQQNEL